MAGKTHPYLQTAFMSAVVFFALIFVVFFLAMYIKSSATSTPTLAPQAVEENIAPPGKVYPRP